MLYGNTNSGHRQAPRLEHARQEAHSDGGGGGATGAGRGESPMRGRCRSSCAIRNRRSRSSALDPLPLSPAASLRLTSSVLPA